MLPYSFAPSCSYPLLFLDLFSVPPFGFFPILDSSTTPGWVAYAVIWEWGYPRLSLSRRYLRSSDLITSSRLCLPASYRVGDVFESPLMFETRRAISGTRQGKRHNAVGVLKPTIASMWRPAGFSSSPSSTIVGCLPRT